MIRQGIPSVREQTPCDAVVTGTPIDLARLIDIHHPVRHATYGLADHGRPTLADALRPFVEEYRKELVVAGATDESRVWMAKIVVGVDGRGDREPDHDAERCAAATARERTTQPPRLRTALISRSGTTGCAIGRRPVGLTRLWKSALVSPT